mmetsp:Transcript_7560/g.24193  ORF Transcript_7560/g.24193 Transcript_7560/m.24193 type:complete len:251 (-) Transcript_7560:527-1279(-)
MCASRRRARLAAGAGSPSSPTRASTSSRSASASSSDASVSAASTASASELPTSGGRVTVPPCSMRCRASSVNVTSRRTGLAVSEARSGDSVSSSSVAPSPGADGRSEELVALDEEEASSTRRAIVALSAAWSAAVSAASTVADAAGAPAFVEAAGDGDGLLGRASSALPRRRLPLRRRLWPDPAHAAKAGSHLPSERRTALSTSSTSFAVSVLASVDSAAHICGAGVDSMSDRAVSRAPSASACSTAGRK